MGQGNGRAVEREGEQGRSGCIDGHGGEAKTGLWKCWRPRKARGGRGGIGEAGADGQLD